MLILLIDCEKQLINGNLGKTLLSTSILQKALELPNNGFFVYNLNGANYNGNDLPVGVYSYGSACIYKRNSESIFVFLTGIAASSTPLATNWYDGASWTGWKTYVTNTDLDTRLPTYYSLNSVTKIKNLPYGIYNLGNSDILKLTDKPSELAGGRCLLITSGASSYDEKVALILASTHQSGGIYFGHIWGTSVNEFAWKKVIGNA